MLPNNLVSSYQQYKADTDAIAAWLATTAKTIGYSDFIPVKPAQPKSQRLKGKARKEAKLQNATPSYTIAIKDFTTLADLIAACKKPTVTVPASLAVVLNRAIAVRKWFSGKIGDHLIPDDEKESSDDRHSYFVGVLEHVRKALQPLMPADAEKETVVESPQNLPNMFENLEVQEPSDEFLKAPDVTPAAKPELPEAHYQAEQYQSMEDDFMAFYLLLADFSKLRTEVSKAWTGYKLGIFDLVSASLATNSAIDFARSLEEQLRDVFERHKGPDRMLNMFYMAQCMVSGSDPNHRERPDDAINFQTYPLAESCFYPPFILIEAFADLVGPKDIPEYKPGFYGEYDPTANRSDMSDREKFAEDRILLMRILPEFALISHTPNPLPAEDEFLRGLRTVFKTHKTPIWVAFAGQIFLDVHHTLRENVDRGYYDLLKTGKHVAKSIQDTLTFHENLRVDTWPPSNDQCLRQLLTRINSMVFEDWNLKAAKSLKSRQFLNLPFFFKKQHPLSCGLWKYHLQASFQEAGVVFAGAWGSIMYTGHLYNAVFAEKLLQTVWKDMEIVFMNQGFDIFFTGDKRPRTADDYFKHFVLSMGYSATAFAKNKSDSRPKASKRGPKGLVELAPVMQTFKDRLVHESGRVDLTPQDVDRILEKSQWDDDDSDWSSDEGGKPDDVLFSLSRGSSRKAKTSKETQKRVQLSPPKIIASLCRVLQAEMLEFSFDYFMLHLVCWGMLRAVKDSCREKLINMYGPDYLEKESQLPFVVGYIFMAATNSKRLGNLIKEKKDDVVTSALLVQAAQTMQRFLADSKGSAVTDALERTFGLGVEFEMEME